MKHTHFLYIILALFIYIGTLSAQTPKWVSTEVQKRTVVLEKFTSCSGIYCADGDRIANTIAEQYPDNFISVNIHCGNFSDYKKYYNLKTDEGNIILDSSGLYEITPSYIAALPLGSVNRSTDPWVLSRDKWDSTAVNIMNQPSIVNVYVRPRIDYYKRKLTVEVEYYYTDDYLGAENYLTVMLLQNEIITYQLYGEKYNPDFSINSNQYRHMHVLRKIISDSGVWGDTITNTIKGDYGYRKYTVTLPDSIKDVPLDLENLEVAAFISESKSNIYTGHKAAVEVIKSELKVDDITEYHKTLKFETIHPKVKVSNNSVVPITKFDITYTIEKPKTIFNLYDEDYNVYEKGYITEIYDTIAVKRDTYSGTLNKGDSIIFELPEITQSEFNTSSIYTAYFSISDVYSNDFQLSDNTTTTSKIVLKDTSFSETELTFEDSNTSSTTGFLPAHVVLDNSLNPYFTIDKCSGGAKNTNSAVLFILDNIYNLSYKPGYIMFGEINCQDNPNKVLTYYYAYCDGMRYGSPSRIVVDISKDWGKTWQRISEIFCKETGVLDDLEKIYVPASDEYKQVQINLSEYTKENFIMRIGGIPGSNGNALWIDEISIKNSSNESIKEDYNLSVYPNPASNILHINNINLLGEEYKIYDMSGKMIIKGINNTNEINIENLSTGTYSIKIKDNIFNFIKK